MLAGLTLLALLVSVPSSLGEAWERGGLYVFTREFFEDIPGRLTGPGKLRFVLQPLIASVIGVRAGLADARAGRPSYLRALLFRSGERGELIRGGLQSVLNVLLMGILADCVAQWLILGACYPGAALVIGPVLILAPYSLARSITGRLVGPSAQG